MDLESSHGSQDQVKIVLRRDFERNRVMNALRTESPASMLENELI